MTTLLELRQVSKIYGSGPARVQALREVDLAVEGGEVLVSGSALSGMTPNQRARLRRRAIGYAFQDFNLLAGVSAVENVALPLELDGVGQRAARGSGACCWPTSRPAPWTRSMASR